MRAVLFAVVLAIAPAARAQEPSDRERIAAIERWIAQRPAEIVSFAREPTIGSVRARRVALEPWILRARQLIREASPAVRRRAITALAALYAEAARDYRDTFEVLRAGLGPRVDGARETYERHAREYECRAYAEWARARAETHLDAPLPTALPPEAELAARCGAPTP